MLTVTYFQSGTRSTGEKKPDTNQSRASVRSKESQREIITAGLAQEPSERTVEQNSLFSLMLSPKSTHQSSEFTAEPIRLEGWFRLPKPECGSDQAVGNRTQVKKLGLGMATGMCTHTYTHTLSLSNFNLYLIILNVI